MKGKHKYCIALFTALVICGSAVATTQMVEGESWSGAKYLLAVPDNWNGDLVVYAHGFIDTAEPIALPTLDDIEPLRDMWTSNGYAVAYSSYSKYGFAVREGTVDTLSLNYYFARHFGRPDRKFLVGHSLGGLVCVRLAEGLPRHYDGVLTVAGMIGGSQAEVDYMADLRILFELYYPGVLPSAIDDVPPGVNLYTDVVFPVIDAITNNPTGAGGIALIDQTPVPWADGSELVTSYVTGLGFWYRGFADMAERTGTEAFFGNRKTVYTSAALPQSMMDDVNLAVDRFRASPRARKYFRKNYEPTGRLCMPHLALHNERDCVVPLFHQALYAEKVTKRGYADMLVQRFSPRYGHTETFSAAEVFGAFEEMVEWVDTGVAPTP
jgi:pimeloyl-ACP methyl ester carboxylesterase